VYLCSLNIMVESTDILKIAYKQPFLQQDLELLHEMDRTVPGSVQYSIRRYRKNPQWAVDDVGVLKYHFRKNEPEENYLELIFCVSGNIYCRQKQTECDYCKLMHPVIVLKKWKVWM
jgi:hypothetical protein